MSAVASPYTRSLVQPDPIPTVQKRASADLKYLVTQRQALIDALDNQMPSMRKNEETDNLRQAADLIAVHKEYIFQIEAGIKAGEERARQNAAPVPAAKK